MKRNKILIGLVVLIIIAGYFYIYKGHRNIAEEVVRFNVNSDAIFMEFQKSETAANSKYLDKTIEVSGTVSALSVEKLSIVLDEKIFAVFLEAIPEAVQTNSKVTVKGRLIGYDSLLEEIRMDQCSIEK
jgi:hypothetical protein